MKIYSFKLENYSLSFSTLGFLLVILKIRNSGNLSLKKKKMADEL